MENKIILITGGQRSGKSRFAEKLTKEISSRPIYMATAQGLDEEMRERIRKHQSYRGDNWKTIEEPLMLSKHNLQGQTVLVECMTLWCSNWLFNCDENVDNALNSMKSEIDSLIKNEDCTIIFVTNETGLGGISTNPLQRKFTELQGWINQYVAEKAQEVYFMVSGIPMKIK